MRAIVEAARVTTIYTLLACAFLAGPVLSALAAPSVITLDEVLSSARTASPQLKLLNAGKQMRDAQAIDEGPPLDPKLSLRTTLRQGGGEEADDEVEAAVAQPLRPSDFGARTTLSSLIREASASAQQGELIELIVALSTEYTALWRHQRSLEVLRDSLAFTDKISQILTTAAERGVADQSLSGLVGAQQKRFQALLLGDTAKLRESKALFARRVGLPTNQLLQADFVPPEIPDLPPLEQIIKKSSEDPRGFLQRLHRLRAEALQRTVVASRDRTGMVEPELGYHHNDAGADQILIGLSFELPAWRSNQAERMRAAAALQSLDAQVSQYQGDEWRVQLELQYETARQLRTQCTQLAEEAVPAFAKLVQLEEERSLQGQGTPLRLWEAGEQLAEVRREQLECHEQAFGASLALLSFAGQISIETPNQLLPE